MPHQCLKCGKVFDEGSSQLLKGCPECGGNRFFFTKQPLTEQERLKIGSEVPDDLTAKITEFIGEQNKGVFEKQGKWVTVKPKEIRKLLEQRLNNEQKTVGEKELPLVFDEAYRKARIEKLKNEAKHEENPETIYIETPGKYKIDVKGLLDQEPIIVHKDGSYTIHLPSIFKMLDKDKEK
ncbi:MAG: Zn-ribbon containing protein [Methanobacteriota archaeon]